MVPRVSGMPACSAAYFGEFVPGTPPAQWFQLPAVGTPSGYTSVDDNQIHHVVWVVTRGTLGGLENSVVTVYVDGVAQSPVINITDDYPIPYGRPLTIGFQHQRLYPTSAPSLDFGFGCDLGDVVVDHGQHVVADRLKVRAAEPHLLERGDHVRRAREQFRLLKGQRRDARHQLRAVDQGQTFLGAKNDGRESGGAKRVGGLHDLTLELALAVADQE